MKLQNGTNTMTDTRRANVEAEPDTPERNSAELNAGGPDAAAPASDAAAAADASAREAAELKDRLLRTLAEMENLRRRTEREVAESRIYGVASFARDILAIADNMARALQTLRAELNEKSDTGVKALLEGVELTERELSKVLEKHGVRKFEPQPREKFDPNLHQAMYEVPDPTLPAGTVAQVVQAGYMIGERMLRPALVAVAKGGPKATADSMANDNADAPPRPDAVG
ncbi:MAG TPA: nucleotide exchange factor GrpE [Xanthobacteraceae bacterium]|nr:nucleotide exchange factor GrpE [Xanthobacteraceae bacterium]